MCLWWAVAAQGAESLVYAASPARGIYGFRFDTRNARLRPLGLMAPVANAGFLLEHPDHRYLYVAGRDGGGSVSAFLIDPRNGKLTLVNTVASGGAEPGHLALDREGRWLAAANGGGSVTILPLRKDGGMAGALAPLAVPGANGVVFSPDNRFLLAAGGDGIHVLRFDVASGALTPAGTFAGRGPMVFHPNGRIVYGLSADAPGVTAFHYNPENGELTHIEDTAVPTTAPLEGIAVNAAGTVVYASAADSMALFPVDPVRFTLSLLEVTPLTGRAPSGFAFDPSGGFMVVADQGSIDLTVYSVHPHTGQLRPASRAVAMEKVAGVVWVAK